MAAARDKQMGSLLLRILALALFFAPVWQAFAADPPPLLLAHTIRPGIDVTRYLVSEKLDGVRAYWDGQILRTRSGQVINAPHWYLEHFPAQPLDGELWAGRGRFEWLSGVVRRQRPDDDWRQVQYMVFELPEAPGDFRARLRAMQRIVGEAGVPWLQVVEQTEVRDRKALEQKLTRLVKAGAEGLMLHRAAAPYSSGRSDDLLKMKPLHDAEATVIAHLPGKGKYRGMLGALRLRTAAGVEFSLGSGLSDALRRNPPPIGTLVTYRYRDVTERGIPRFASYYRVRDF